MSIAPRRNGAEDLELRADPDIDTQRYRVPENPAEAPFVTNGLHSCNPHGAWSPGAIAVEWLAASFSDRRVALAASRNVRMFKRSLW